MKSLVYSLPQHTFNNTLQPVTIVMMYRIFSAFKIPRESQETAGNFHLLPEDYMVSFYGNTNKTCVVDQIAGFESQAFIT